VVKYGSNKNRNHLNHVWEEDWPKSKLESPIIKGKGFTPRGKKPKMKRRNVLGSLDDHITPSKRGKEKLKWRSMILDDTQ